MGTSTNGILCYGIEVQDDTNEHYSINEKFENISVGMYKDKVVWHCSSDYKMFIIAAKDSVTSASRGYPEKFGQRICRDLKWEEEVREACAALGVEYRQPQWLLCSYWG